MEYTARKSETRLQNESESCYNTTTVEPVCELPQKVSDRKLRAFNVSMKPVKSGQLSVNDSRDTLNNVSALSRLSAN